MARTRVSSKLNNYLDYFNIGVKKGDNVPDNEALYATKKVTKKTRSAAGKDWKIEKESWPDSVQRLWDKWTNDTSVTYDNKNRFDMYRDQDKLFMESAIISRAMKLYAAETVQADSNMNTIGIESKHPKQIEFAKRTIERLGIENLLESTALNVIQYGDDGWNLSMNEKGIISILPTSCYDIQDRIEFTPSEVEKELRLKKGNLSQLNSKTRVKMLIDAIKETDKNQDSYLKSYLFGFQINDFVLPPWRFIHFRNYKNKSAFKPYGMPQFITAVAPWRKYNMAETLQVVQQGANFPREVFELNFPNVGGDPTERFEAATEFMRAFDNSGFLQTKKEGTGVSERIVTIKDLYEYRVESPDIDIASVDNLELLRDDMIIITGLPRNFLDPNNGSFGNSGVALREQHKPFARDVFHYQTILLEGITQVIKMDMIRSGAFPLTEIDFYLTMPFPEAQTDRDLISSQSDLLDLANEILDSLAERIGVDLDDLPSDLVLQVYTQILPYDAERIEGWATMIDKARKEVSVEEEREHLKMVEKAVKSYGKKQIREDTKQFFYEKKKRYVTNTAFQGKHHFSSSIPNEDFDVSKLVDIKKMNMKKFVEEFSIN